jgi:hypothetical protein
VKQLIGQQMAGSNEQELLDNIEALKEKQIFKENTQIQLQQLKSKEET